MFGLGLPELCIIMVLALMIFGPGKLPKVAESVGEAMRGLRKAFDDPPGGGS